MFFFAVHSHKCKLILPIFLIISASFDLSAISTINFRENIKEVFVNYMFIFLNCPFLLHRKSPQTLWTLQTSTLQDTQWKTDTKPSSPVRDLSLCRPLTETVLLWFSLLYCRCGLLFTAQTLRAVWSWGTQKKIQDRSVTSMQTTSRWNSHFFCFNYVRKALFPTSLQKSVLTNHCNRTPNRHKLKLPNAFNGAATALIMEIKVSGVCTS